MGLPVETTLLTPEEYLRIERAAPFRSEYFAGRMTAMAGGLPNHSLIKVNMVAELSNTLKSRPWRVYDSDLRVRVSATGLYTYPDASVVCGELQFDDNRRDTILNPTLLAEVLSDGTEGYDRGKKFGHYRNIPSLREYLLISQDSPTVERFLRNADDTWTLTVVTGLEHSLELPSLDVTISLAEIFDKVDFSSV